MQITAKAPVSVVGLTAQEAEARLNQSGPNEPAATRRHSLLSGPLHAFTHLLILILLISATALSASPQSKSDLETFLRQNIGLTRNQIASIQSGQPFAKNLPSRSPDEVVLPTLWRMRSRRNNFIPATTLRLL